MFGFIKRNMKEIQNNLHSCDHNLIDIGETKHYNVSLKNERYEPVYDPLIIEI